MRLLPIGPPTPQRLLLISLGFSVLCTKLHFFGIYKHMLCCMPMKIAQNQYGLLAGDLSRSCSLYSSQNINRTQVIPTDILQKKTTNPMSGSLARFSNEKKKFDSLKEMKKKLEAVQYIH